MLFPPFVLRDCAECLVLSNFCTNRKTSSRHEHFPTPSQGSRGKVNTVTGSSLGQNEELSGKKNPIRLVVMVAFPFFTHTAENYDVSSGCVRKEIRVECRLCSFDVKSQLHRVGRIRVPSSPSKQAVFLLKRPRQEVSKKQQTTVWPTMNSSRAYDEVPRASRKTFRMFPSPMSLDIMLTLTLGITVALVTAVMVPPVDAAGLANCPLGCQCDDDTLVVTCEEGQLDVLPIVLNPSLHRLVIKNNKIKTIDSSMQFYAELTFLDLSYNHLFNMPPPTFAYQKKLTELHLNHNKVGSITNRTFIGLVSLTILNLRGNFLDELPEGVFSVVPKLEELNLGQNRIAKIDPKAFVGLTNLKVLYLDDNTISTVPSPALTPLRSLAELYIGLNSFTSIPKEAFGMLTGLSRLDLNGAALLNVTRDSFHGVERLRTLDISDNRFTRIPTAELAPLDRLEELIIGQNDFDSIPAGAFAGLSNLRMLDISGSLRLNRIESGAFEANTNLEEIVIASNKALTEIQEGALSGLPHLRRIVLKDNALTTLTDGMLSWNELVELDLSENPILCDCQILWLRNLLVSKSNSSSTLAEGMPTPVNQIPVVCAAPDRLREQVLQNLSPELLGCSHPDRQQQAIICVVLVGAAAILTTLALVIYKCRRRIQEVVKGSWGNNGIGRKEREYQKTFSEEDYSARHPHPGCPGGGGGLGIHPTTLNNYQINNHHHHSHGIRHIPLSQDHLTISQQQEIQPGMKLFPNYTPPIPPHHHHNGNGGLVVGGGISPGSSNPANHHYHQITYQTQTLAPLRLNQDHFLPSHSAAGSGNKTNTISASVVGVNQAPTGGPTRVAKYQTHHHHHNHHHPASLQQQQGAGGGGPPMPSSASAHHHLAHGGHYTPPPDAQMQQQQQLHHHHHHRHPHRDDISSDREDDDDTLDVNDDGEESHLSHPSRAAHP
ncbi:leucine-rich repeat-containing protein 4B [Anopheles sinensis]|uniref:Leucine-rich repeat-containing protein 4B n=1 Tax=Anopheles sinensis TaxID=74873 RepID=A0A084WNV5_ANOSI|nr:leucine-rich repeat-containing protein 4B [Anopheles sinensis]